MFSLRRGAMGPVDLPCTKLGQPTETEIREELERIFASAEFQSTQRCRAFLQFIVDEVFAGRSGSIKAFTIANSVFGRNVSFDPQSDPIVRTEAGRLRRALERYYLVVGNADRVVITIPKGAYVPVFSYTDDSTPASHRPAVNPNSAAELAPIVHPSSRAHTIIDVPGLSWVRYALPAGVVLLAIAAFVEDPLKSIVVPATIAREIAPRILIERLQSGAPSERSLQIADGLRDAVIVQLAKAKDIVVIADQAAKGKTPTHAARYALQGSAAIEENRIRYRIRLVRKTDGAVIWASNYGGDLRSQGVFQIQDGIARDIASAVAWPCGTLFQTDAGTLGNEPPNGTLGGASCMVASADATNYGAADRNATTRDSR